MRSTVHVHDDGGLWEVARPDRPSRVAGVTMAGFRDHGGTPADLVAIPHPAVTLAVEFGAAQPVVDDATGRRQRGSIVAGLGLGFGAVRVRATNFECVQVRLSPVIARAVLGASLADLNGAVVALDDLWGREVSRLRERLGELSSWEARFALLEAVLAHRGAEGPSVDPEVAWAWRRIGGGHGMVRVDALAAEVGWSRKRMWSRFGAQIGLPPKRAATLVRFDHAAHRLVAGDAAARVAAESGYADQSHLHRDFVACTGATPTMVAGEPWLAVDEFAWSGHIGRRSPVQDARP